MAISGDDDGQIRPAALHVIGQDLSTLSIDELEHRVTLLKEEILRLETAAQRKSAQRSAADSVFAIR